jgi:FkbM family methyltransferase
MKQMILGTPIGRIAISSRDAFELWRAACFHPETIGTLANDRMATVLVSRICRPNKALVDIGAHIGSIVAAVMQYERSVRIVAIEAIPEKIANLRRKFPGVEFHQCAVGEWEGDASFFINTRRSGYSSLGRPPADPSDRSVTEIRVPIRKLDSLISSDDVDVVKIDVEGAELGVLRGSTGLLARCRPTIMFESGPQSSDGLEYTKEALWEILSAEGYAVVVPNRVAHNDLGLSREGFIESHLYPRRTTNYFAIPKERRDEIRCRARDVLRISG